MMSLRRALLLALLMFVALPSLAQAAVQPRFDLSSPEGGPFPSNRWTTFDWSQNTGLRVNLPKPDCAVRPSDCADIDVLNTLDGFNIQPRISIPFTGPIDPSSVNSSNVFLISVPDFKVTGINQIAWEPATNTLHVESDQLLRQHTTYILVVTTEVRDATGKRIQSAFFRPHMHGDMSDLVRGLPGKLHLPDVAVATVFTTQSATSLLEKVRRQIDASTPAAANFVIGNGGERTVFPLAGVTSILFSRQTGTAPTFAVSPTGTPFLAGVGTVAFGAFDAPDYETASKVIPAVGTRTGVPAVQGTNRLYFNLFLPAGTAPAGRVAGGHLRPRLHGQQEREPVRRRRLDGAARDRDDRDQRRRSRVRPARHADREPHGRWARGAAAGGRGFDQNGDGTIDSTEGVNAAPPQTLVSSRDGLRQTVIDLMSSCARSRSAWTSTATGRVISTRRRSRTSASRSAASTGRSSSPSSRPSARAS